MSLMKSCLTSGQQQTGGMAEGGEAVGSWGGPRCRGPAGGGAEPGVLVSGPARHGGEPLAPAHGSVWHGPTPGLPSSPPGRGSGSLSRACLLLIPSAKRRARG